MAFIKVESEDMKIEEAFTVKHEDTEEQQTEMMFIIEKSGDVKIEDFRVKYEDTEEQTGWFHSQSLSPVILHHLYCIYYMQLVTMNEMSHTNLG